MSLRVVPAGSGTWPAVAAVMATPGDPVICWCQVFRHPREDWDARPVEQNRADLEALVGGSVAPGLVAYDGDEPVAWVSVAPLAELTRILTSDLFLSVREDGEDLTHRWVVTCFVVRDEARGQGLLPWLLRAAVEYAREQGADVLEGYPLDLARAEEVTADSLFCGTVRHFESQGFTARAPLGPTRTLMTRRL